MKYSKDRPDYESKELMYMGNYTVISIGREYGSGGHEIGTRVAERLGIPLYDRNLVQMAANKLGISRDAAAEVDETILGRFLSGYVVNTGDYTTFAGSEDDGELLSDRLFEIQSEIIKKLAGRGPCVIIGRCADYVLKDQPGCINIFVKAAEEDRVRRVMEIGKISEKEAKERIQKIDGARKLYYEAHTGSAWGSIQSHEMMFNSSIAGIEKVVDALEALFKSRV